ncbi:MAG: hypothetical protein IJZ62_01235 [Clostridia bacterium]|nr:hypothetical protein [Clostridia bacterium]
MENLLVMEIIKTNFGLEIANKVECTQDEIIVYLEDGTKAKITTKNM